MTAGQGEGNFTASKRGGNLPLGRERGISPPAKGVDDDRWAGRGEFHRQQKGWKLTAGQGEGNFTASRGETGLCVPVGDETIFMR